MRKLPFSGTIFSFDTGIKLQKTTGAVFVSGNNIHKAKLYPYLIVWASGFLEGEEVCTSILITSAVIVLVGLPLINWPTLKSHSCCKIYSFHMGFHICVVVHPIHLPYLSYICILRIPSLFILAESH